MCASEGGRGATFAASATSKAYAFGSRDRGMVTGHPCQPEGGSARKGKGPSTYPDGRALLPSERSVHFSDKRVPLTNFPGLPCQVLKRHLGRDWQRQAGRQVALAVHPFFGRHALSPTCSESVHLSFGERGVAQQRGTSISRMGIFMTSIINR